MWNKITGHSKQKNQLRQVIQGGNIPHAYLFTGIEGIGKRLVARAFAHELLGNLENHPDLVEIEPSETGQITIDEIRNVKDKLKFAPLKGKQRIIIINNAEAMNVNAANAALKVLEEPPRGNHFLLITSATHQLLPTIISRCQKMEFSPLTDEQVEGFLKTTYGYSNEQALQAAKIGDGSIGRSVNIDAELIDRITSDLSRLVESPTSLDILSLSEKWAGEKENIDNILYILHRYYHSRLLSETGSSERLAEKCGLINKAHGFVQRTYNKQLMFEQLLFSLAG